MKEQYCSLVRFALITSAADASATLNVYDIRLGDRGGMQGHLIDGQGQPLARKAGVVSFGGRRVATAVTDRHGAFRIQGLRPGLHGVSIGLRRWAVRLWSANSAPNTVRPGLLLVETPPAVRGLEPYRFGNIPYGTAIRNTAIIGVPGLLGGVIGFNYGLDERSPASP